MTIFSTVPCTEVHGTRKESGALTSGPSASVSLQCDYDQRWDLREDLLTNGEWPFTPIDKSAPIVQKVDVVPLETDYTEDGQAIAYKYAQLDVEYGFDSSSNSSGGGGGPGAGAGRQYFTETLEPQLEVISVQETKLYFMLKDGDIPSFRRMSETNYPMAHQYTFGITRTFYNWIYVPASFRTNLGKINNAAVNFTTLGLPFAAEEILFIPINASRSISSEGTQGFTVQVKFLYKSGGWNKIRLPELGVPWGKEKEIYIEIGTAAKPNPVQFKPYLTTDLSGWIF